MIDRLASVLMGTRASAPGGGMPDHFGIAKIMRFAATRRRIGLEASAAILACLADRMRAIEGLELRRVGRTSIEFLFDAADPRALLETIKASLEQPVLAGDVAFEPEIFIGAAPGLATRPLAEVMEQAIWASEDAENDAGRIRIADVEIEPNASPSEPTLAELRAAIHGGTLALHYMPKLRLTDETVVGAEALCRWRHPVHGMIPPATFIGIAEESGLIGDLTFWVLAGAIGDQERLLDKGLDLQIDINVSAQLLDNPAFCDRLISAIAAARGRIGIEITETAVIRDPARALASLERLRAAGIHVAIDDFGAGLASFGYLRDLPADELKIDQMFVRKLTTSQRDPLLVRSAIDIAHALEMDVTAEGVEDPIALALLRVMRCDHVQGYHISPPLPLAELIAFIADADAEAETAPTELTAKSYRINQS